jgi:hypothetical protein
MLAPAKIHQWNIFFFKNEPQGDLFLCTGGWFISKLINRFNSPGRESNPHTWCCDAHVISVRLGCNHELRLRDLIIPLSRMLTNCFVFLDVFLLFISLKCINFWFFSDHFLGRFLCNFEHTCLPNLAGPQGDLPTLHRLRMTYFYDFCLGTESNRRTRLGRQCSLESVFFGIGVES